MQFELRPFQKEALQALEKNPAHLICVAPTGAGKSLIYETMAKKPGTRMILVTPLVALARQQHQRLQSAGVRATLAAGPEPEPPPSKKSGVWILSPERLCQPKTLKYLEQWKPNFLVMDECHCLWDWGDRFRPSFLAVPELLRSHPSITRSLWLTATLPQNAREELRAKLPEPLVEIGEFDLAPSLELIVRHVPWADRMSELMSWLEIQTEAGIVFVQTRTFAERLVQLISASGRRCALYHAGLESEERRITEKKIENRLPEVVVATSAFGMGMDHAHLRWALLWQAPPSLLALAQAVGRAGRDSRIGSRAVIFWSEDDFRLLEWMVFNSARQKQELTQVHHYLTSEGCRKQRLRNYFDSRDALSLCHQCDFCLEIIMTI